ncbi:LPS export ABC transporter permease LptF [Oceanisphaera pacifica]|uniref:Lipopolysaccharide export system permease protein LptF n=1 Tax=Oceanisphaera pacifica TaxID=2818389 RepID=A0ABS3NFF9_9GAMM|nr:LPS export ABC transporter permease LptF [Oceanisphaera pacifica]
MIAFRYLFWETLKTQLAVLFVLLLIFISQNFIEVLGGAANGTIPVGLVGKLLLLNMPDMATLMLPISLFLGILFAHGRLYADSEMTVMRAVGIGPGKIMTVTLVLALFWTGAALFNSLWLNPWSKAQVYQIREEVKADPGFSLLRQARFMSLDGGRVVAYIENLDAKSEADNSSLSRLFVVQRAQNEQAPSIVVADSGRFHERDGGQWLTLDNGRRYSGVPGNRAFDIAEFEEYSAFIQASEIDEVERKESSASSKQLSQSTNIEDIAELQWRVSLPLSMLVLVFLVVPLAVLRPRQGRYAKLLPGILLYLAYFLLQSAARSAVEAGSLPIYPGLYTVPLAFLLFVGLPLNLRETAWWSRTREKFKRNKAA